MAIMGVRWIIRMEMLGMPNMCTDVSGGVNTSCEGIIAILDRNCAEIARHNVGKC